MTDKDLARCNKLNPSIIGYHKSVNIEHYQLIKRYGCSYTAKCEQISSWLRNLEKENKRSDLYRMYGKGIFATKAGFYKAFNAWKKGGKSNPSAFLKWQKFFNKLGKVI
jgi:hypothetical protein